MLEIVALVPLDPTRFGLQSELSHTLDPCSLTPDPRLSSYTGKSHSKTHDGEPARMAYPQTTLYPPNMNGSPDGAIGITDYAQNSLGDIVYVDAPKVGDRSPPPDVLASVESVKAVSDLYSPVTGTVTAVNEELKDSPDKINEAPTTPGSSRSNSPTQLS